MNKRKFKPGDRIELVKEIQLRKIFGEYVTFKRGSIGKIYAIHSESETDYPYRAMFGEQRLRLNKEEFKLCGARVAYNAKNKPRSGVGDV